MPKDVASVVAANNATAETEETALIKERPLTTCEVFIAVFELLVFVIAVFSLVHLDRRGDQSNLWMDYKRKLRRQERPLCMPKR